MQGKPFENHQTVPARSRLQHFRVVSCMLRPRGRECLFNIAQIGKNCLRGKLPMPMLHGYRTGCPGSVAGVRLADVAPLGGGSTNKIEQKGADYHALSAQVRYSNSAVGSQMCVDRESAVPST